MKSILVKSCLFFLLFSQASIISAKTLTSQKFLNDESKAINELLKSKEFYESTQTILAILNKVTSTNSHPLFFKLITNTATTSEESLLINRLNYTTAKDLRTKLDQSALTFQKSIATILQSSSFTTIQKENILISAINKLGFNPVFCELAYILCLGNCNISGGGINCMGLCEIKRAVCYWSENNPVWFIVFPFKGNTYQKNKNHIHKGYPIFNSLGIPCVFHFV